MANVTAGTRIKTLYRRPSAMPARKQSVMVKLIVSNGSHGWRSSHISLFSPTLIWERYATFVSGLEVSLPPGSRDPHLHNFDHLAASMHELGHHPRCRGAIRR